MSRNPSRYLFLAFLFLILVVGCKRFPSGVIPPDRMAVLLADMYEGESMIDYNGNIYFTDSAKKVVKQSIFAANNVTQEDFDNSLNWYGHHIEEYLKVCDDAIAILEQRLEAVPPDATASSVQIAGDSAQVWQLPTFFRITNKVPSNFISFILNSDDEWKPGDAYDLNLKVLPGKAPIKATLATDYSDGFTQYINASQGQNGWLKTHLQLDSTKTAKRIYGFINFAPDQNEVIYLDSISLMRTRVNRNTYFRRSNAKSINIGTVFEEKDVEMVDSVAGGVEEK